MGDLGLTFAMGQDGAPDYTEISYGIGDFGDTSKNFIEFLKKNPNLLLANYPQTPSQC